MRQPAVLGLRRRADDQGGDARGLGGHDVHDHSGRVDGEAAGRVETDPGDRQPALGDGAAGCDPRGEVGALLVGVRGPGAGDGLFEGVAHGGVEAFERAGQLGLGHPHGGGPHLVELLGELEDGGHPAVPDGLDDGPDPMQRGVHVELGRGRMARSRAGPGTAERRSVRVSMTQG